MMKKMLQKKLNKKGFTLAELLIVVAILAVLVAIAIPTFQSALTKAQTQVTEANTRAAQSAGMAAYYELFLDNPSNTTKTGDITQQEGNKVVTYTWTFDAGKISVEKKSST